ncbi:YbfB/YjiJ family MFS transporter [Bradyrhizobium tropiciagri]|uniref:YbfB/YjiJ family MFS transporter n=1 Tax=Bradyrhizobium tropiciagri TaxID=312253 RepID=UPI001BAD69C3|nr:YbfB/YjiJ family MFS transporter [Bradyrhizobium tropiciagri]MBR0869455.1 YbfB/YjiJ family MFS transporter [Bradyrhizobium tropiciagri]
MPHHSQSLSPAQVDRILVWRHIFAGLSASLVSIGLARFAFTPLIPELIKAQWFSASAVIYLGAANLAGYLGGALLARLLAMHVSKENTLRLMMLIITAAFFACATPLSFVWYFGWRLLSGVAGGVVMVLVTGTVLPHVPKARRGIAGGAIFLGLGLGIAGSGTIVPLLLNLGLSQTWLGLGIFSAILTAASWFAWPASGLNSGSEPDSSASAATHWHAGPRVGLLYAQYALMATAAVPPMVFLVDFIARGLGDGIHAGAIFWIWYGVGAIAGPPLYGLLADRVGPRPTVRLVVTVQAAALFGLYATDNRPVLVLLTIIIGTFAPGIVPLALARVRESIPHSAHRQNVVWSRATILSAAAMAVAGSLFSALLNISGGNHRMLFLTAAGLLLLVLLGEIVPRARTGEIKPMRAT